MLLSSRVEKQKVTDPVGVLKDKYLRPSPLLFHPQVSPIAGRAGGAPHDRTPGPPAQAAQARAALCQSWSPKNLTLPPHLPDAQENPLPADPMRHCEAGGQGR